MEIDLDSSVDHETENDMLASIYESRIPLKNIFQLMMHARALHAETEELATLMLVVDSTVIVQGATKEQYVNKVNVAENDVV